MLPKTTCSLSQPYLLHYTIKTCASLHFNAQLGFSGSYGRFRLASHVSVVLMAIKISTEKYNSPSEF